MNRVLIVLTAAIATYHALYAAEQAERVRSLTDERDGLLRAALRAQRASTVERITAERRPHQGLTEAGLLRMAGLRDCQ